MYAIVEKNIVINIIVWDGKGDWRPESGEAVNISEGQDVNIGDEYKKGVFVSKKEPIEQTDL